MTPRDRIAVTLNLLRLLWPDHAGPAHIVLADCNLRDGDIQACLNTISRGEEVYSRDHPDASHPIHVATAALLAHLLTVPEQDRADFAAGDDFYRLYEWRDK